MPDVAKLLVQKARRKRCRDGTNGGRGWKCRPGKNISVLVLDTSTGSRRETFYQRAGWQKWGNRVYALMPDGAMTATYSVFYKFL